MAVQPEFMYFRDGRRQRLRFPRTNLLKQISLKFYDFSVIPIELLGFENVN